MFNVEAVITYYRINPSYSISTTPSLPLPSPLPPSLSLFPRINGLNLKHLEDNLFRKKSYFTDEIRLYGSYNLLNIFIVCEDAF